MPNPISRLTAALEGRYVIERELGEGGMATVYLAHDERHDRPVAIKVLKPELAAVVGAERFLAEIKTTANLQHPHILPLFDSGEADSFLYYVMPFVEGESLRERIDRDGQLPVEEAVAITSRIALALEAAHGHGVIHRDIKPDNILLSGGEPLVADFGIALAVHEAGGGRLTETGLSVGTPHYMSPEQATGEQHVGAATDTYALGCLLYEMLTGEPPYTGATAQAILGRILTDDLRPVRSHRKSVPIHVDAAVQRALEKLAADRFARTSELADALANPSFRWGEPETGTVAAGTSGLWRLWAVAATGAATVLGILLAGSPRSSGDRAVSRLSIRIESIEATAPGYLATRVTFAPDGIAHLREEGRFRRSLLGAQSAEWLGRHAHLGDGGGRLPCGVAGRRISGIRGRGNDQESLHRWRAGDHTGRLRGPAGRGRLVRRRNHLVCGFRPKPEAGEQRGWAPDLLL